MSMRGWDDEKMGGWVKVFKRHQLLKAKNKVKIGFIEKKRLMFFLNPPLPENSFYKSKFV